MKMRPVHEVHTVSSSQEAIHATVDAENLGVVLNMLSNVYSDPIMAVVREYSTNAWDSHVAAGVERPIEVSLPDAESSQPVLVIRDFGLGLDMAELRKTYLSYGASTKRDSDAFNGTLGIGSKSGLTYAPLGFQVAAVKDGHKILAVIAQDEQGVGVMQILAEFDTDESNGVTITIPVQVTDAWKFANRAERLYRYWRPGTVLVDGEQPESIHDDESLVWLEEDVALGRGFDSVVVMGNVAYPVQVENDYGYSVLAYVPMGSVHFTPSREDLHYTEMTNETLDLLREYVAGRAKTVVVDFVKDVGAGYHRLKEFHALKDLLGYSRGRAFERAIRPFLPREPQALPNGGSRWKAARRNGTSTFESLHWGAVREESDVIVLNFPGRNLTPTAKTRLNRFADEVLGVCQPYFTVINAKTDGTPVDSDLLEMIEGRRNVWTWEQIVEATPPLPRVKGGSRPKTQYTVRHGVKEFQTEMLDPKRGQITWIEHSSSYRALSDKAEVTPEAQIVMLKANQVDRFLRLHPTAKSWHGYRVEQHNAVQAALTEADRIQRHRGSWTWLADKHHVIDDPEFAEMLRLCAADAKPSSTARRANRLGVTIHEPKMFGEMEERYPLLDGVSSWSRSGLTDDLVLYLNAKWAEIEAEREVAAAAEAITKAAVGEEVE